MSALFMVLESLTQLCSAFAAAEVYFSVALSIKTCFTISSIYCARA